MQPKICTEWLHTLTWLNDVWSGVTPGTSPIPSLSSVSPSRTQAREPHTDSLSLSCVLKIDASYYQSTLRLTGTVWPFSSTKPLPHPHFFFIFITDICSSYIPAATCHGGGASQIITSTHMRNSELACRGGIQGVMTNSQFWKLEGKFRLSTEIVLWYHNPR